MNSTVLTATLLQLVVALFGYSFIFSYVLICSFDNAFINLSDVLLYLS